MDHDLVQRALAILTGGGPLREALAPTPTPATHQESHDGSHGIGGGGTGSQGESRRDVSPGKMVTWTSPLFGRLSGEVVENEPDGVIVWHLLTEALGKIPIEWLVHSSGTDEN